MVSVLVNTEDQERRTQSAEEEHIPSMERTRTGNLSKNKGKSHANKISRLQLQAQRASEQGHFSEQPILRTFHLLCAVDLTKPNPKTGLREAAGPVIQG